jgi:F-type H+-transporting ATPase subunit delta
MKIDRHSRQLAKHYFRACLRPDGSVDDDKLREVLHLLATEKPRGCVKILSRLQRLVEIAVEERTVRLESATPLPDRGAAIFADLAQRFGPATNTIYHENPALLGGLRIRRGSTIWDGTLSTRLQRLEQALG